MREVALDLSPLIGDKALEFELQAEPASVMGHDWMLRELTRNLLHNAIRESPRGTALLVKVQPTGEVTVKMPEAKNATTSTASACSNPSTRGIRARAACWAWRSAAASATPSRRDCA